MIFRLHEEVLFERKRRSQESCDSLAVFDVRLFAWAAPALGVTTKSVRVPTVTSLRVPLFGTNLPARNLRGNAAGRESDGVRHPDVILLTVENCCWLRGPKNEEKQESPDQGNHDRCEEQEIQNRGEKGGENGDS